MTKISFFLNQQQYTVNKSITVLDILTYLNYNMALFVLEYNKKIISKAEFSKTSIKSNDCIEIITIVGGG